MGKMAEFAEDWLNHCGYELGYGYDNIPGIKECIAIKQAYDQGYLARHNKLKSINELTSEYKNRWSIEVEYDKDGGKRIMYYKDKDKENT